MRESHFLSPPETILSIATAAIRAPDGLRWPYTRQKQYALIFIKADFHMCSFKFLTFKFDFDIIKIEHRFLSFIVCLFNYNFGASYVLFQYLFLIILHFSVMRDFCFIWKLGQFTRNYTQTTKRGLLTTNKGWVSSTGKVRDIQPVLLSGVSKGACPLAHDFARKV